MYLILDKITKTFPPRGGSNEVKAVKEADLQIRQGELVTLLGPSGCGKTTILRVVGGFLTADEGKVILGGQDITYLPPEKRPTAMVFQSYNLWPHMTVFENLSFGLKLRKIPHKTIAEEVSRFLALFSLDGNGNPTDTGNTGKPGDGQTGGNTGTDGNPGGNDQNPSGGGQAGNNNTGDQGSPMTSRVRAMEQAMSPNWVRCMTPVY